jgi:double-stranded uracil-DNA glycosylase
MLACEPKTCYPGLEVNAVMDNLAPPTLPDYLAPNLAILFVGLNPAIYAARRGHYYARPGNLFWRALYEAGLVPERLAPEDDQRLLEFGIGLTDLVKRPTDRAAQVTPLEWQAGRHELLAKVERYRPRIVCFNGLQGYREAFDRQAQPGLQRQPLGEALAFVVPSTSGLNAGYPRSERIEWFRRLRTLSEGL